MTGLADHKEPIALAVEERLDPLSGRRRLLEEYRRVRESDKPIARRLVQSALVSHEEMKHLLRLQFKVLQNWERVVPLARLLELRGHPTGPVRR